MADEKLLEQILEITKELKEDNKIQSSKIDKINQSLAEVKTKIDNFDNRIDNLESWKEKRVSRCEEHRKEINKKIEKNSNVNTSQQSWVDIVEKIFTKAILALVGFIVAYLYFQ